MTYANFETMPLVLSVEDIADTLAIGRNKAYSLVNSGVIKDILLWCDLTFGKPYRRFKGAVLLGKPNLSFPNQGFVLPAVIVSGHQDTGAKVSAHTVSRVHKLLKSAFGKAVAWAQCSR